MFPPAMPATTIHCRECNRLLSSAESEGLCARCLLKLGLASQFDGAAVANAGMKKFIAPPLFPFDFGGYRVVRLLGRGGMGAVYDAEQIDTGRHVALKVLGHTIDSPEMRARFLREGRLAAAVNHPNSVYIYGTEEIEGAPVIAMELVAGGTLRDRLRKGTMAVSEAVDATLKVVAGLEAAAEAGVLHRDVKPANCFVAPDGTVKVGDFGLSVSTLAHDDTQLTASGMMLGTPSYAPPEQLRGDELDVRADIYSVGATLYALLAGCAPFDGENAVNVVAAVLDQEPRPLSQFRHDVPADLARIVARCLEKKRDDRFANYAELRDALLPFSASVPDPAPLGLRFVAGVIDNTIAFLPNTIMTVILGHGLSNPPMGNAVSAAWGYFGILALATVYFAGCEGRWGATPAKALCGLRVVGPDGGAPGFARALSRAAIYVLAFQGVGLLHALFGESMQYRLVAAMGPSLYDGASLLFYLLFATMRRRNGYATVYELVSGTRTVARVKATARPRLRVPPLAMPDNAEGVRIGAYRVLSPLADGRFLAAYDEVLRRQVWIRPCPAGTPPLDAARREIGRAARQRWIGGARSPASNWDAFEALAGRPLRELTAQPWAAVRGWLHDLAEEIDAATKDGTLPAEISIDHVWVTVDGRAELLDEPWPVPAPAPAPAFTCADPAGTQHFLSAVAGATLDRSALPVGARDFLNKLNAAAFDRVSFIRGNLQSLLAKPASVSRRRRFAALALAPGGALLVSLFMELMVTFSLRQHAKQAGPRAQEWRELSSALRFHAAVRGENELGSEVALRRWTSFYTMARGDATARKSAQNEAMAKSAESYVSGHFGKLIQAPSFDGDAEAAGLDSPQRELAHLAVAAQPVVSPERLRQVDLELGPALRMMEGFSETIMPLFGLMFFAALLLFIGAGSLLGAAIFGCGPLIYVLGLAIVDREGRPAGRGRLLARSALVWGPLVAGWVALVALHIRLGATGLDLGYLLLIFALLGFLMGVPWTILRPAAGPHDLLTRTRVVPQ